MAVVVLTPYRMPMLTYAVTVDLGGGTATGGTGTDKLLNIENIIGSAFDDTLTGNASNNVINGGAGYDAMNGGAGNDTYYVDAAGDSVSEAGAAASTNGIDLINSTIDYSLKSSNQYRKP